MSPPIAPRRFRARPDVLAWRARNRRGRLGGVVKTLRPQNYNEVLYVGHYFRKGVTVLMDLTDLPEEEAKQLVDFATGLVFARRGSLDRVDRRLFLLQP
ncbi:hypothetical protein DMH08_21860 [Actinomadura sp. WAC 06369]|nr:hypothetical protein DMH08_21860 [Actinomadura sp. WAC 06369]